MRPAWERRGEVPIAPTVFFAYTDSTATASRALFGVDTRDRKYDTLDIPLLKGFPPACVHPPQTKVTKTMPPMFPIQVINCRFEDHKPQVTFLIINTHVPSEKSHYVARALVELFAQRYVMKLAILTAQRMDVEQKSKLFENAFNGMAPVTNRSRLPADTIIMDAFLSNFIQLLTVEGQPFTVVIAPAHRSTPGPANEEDRSLQLIRLFQNTVTNSSGLLFYERLSTGLVYHDLSDAQATLMYA